MSWTGKRVMWTVWSRFSARLPVILRTVPETSYTVTCLPLHTVTESCWHQTHLFNMNLNVNKNTNDTFSPSRLHVYLGNTDSLDVHVRLKSRVRSRGKLRDAELGRCELHCCYLLVEVCAHHMLTQDQHSVGVVCRQQIQTGTPLQ